MADALGWRGKIGVAIPSTNTILQPDFEVMRPLGITNHTGRIMIPNMTIGSDEDFKTLMGMIDVEIYAAVDRLMTAAPDRMLVGISSFIFWEGLEASEARRAKLEAHAGVPVTGGSFGMLAALRALGATRVAVLSPYPKIANDQVTRFLGDGGIEVRRFRTLECTTPLEIAEVGEDRIRAALLEIDGDDVDALVQAGTNLSMLRLAAEAERWLAKPVLSINAVTYWHVLREMGVADRIDGFGTLLENH